MFLEIFRFELLYRLKKVETYLFLAFILVFSICGVEFIFQGVELGIVKKSSPVVIAKTMGAICGLTCLIISMVMGVPVLRDYKYGMTSIIFHSPIQKWEYLLGKFLGSLIILLVIFLMLLVGMMTGPLMPWITPEEYGDFHLMNYMQPFLWVALPIILFAGILFFVSGALSKSMMIVYIQSIALFVLFLLTKAIDHDTLRAMLDPFSLTTLTEINKDLTPEESNSNLLPWHGLLLYKNTFWAIASLVIFLIGFRRFDFTTSSKPKKSRKKTEEKTDLFQNAYKVQKFTQKLRPIKQLLHNTIFIVRVLTRQTLFWAIIVSGAIIITINSVNLGTVHDVNSLPTTYLIVEELTEMSVYFFAFILIIYSGEVIWKERASKLSSIVDSTPISIGNLMLSKFLGLIIIYTFLLAALAVSGILLQTSMGYFDYDLHVYFASFFLELLPLLILYTAASFFFQSLTNQKFTGMILTIIFFICTILSKALISDHTLLSFGGSSLPTYSEINGYDRYLLPFLLGKIHWLFVASFFFIGAVLVKSRGESVSRVQRIKKGFQE